tara:strand:- start:61 stop:261 length:201 start_codon:yes stop_codon:yes gene_type:complete
VADAAFACSVTKVHHPVGFISMDIGQQQAQKAISDCRHHKRLPEANFIFLELHNWHGCPCFGVLAS